MLFPCRWDISTSPNSQRAIWNRGKFLTIPKPFQIAIIIICIRILSYANNFIQGDTMGDAVCSLCCAALVNCQTAAEIKARTGGGAPAAE